MQLQSKVKNFLCLLAVGFPLVLPRRKVWLLLLTAASFHSGILACGVYPFYFRKNKFCISRLVRLFILSYRDLFQIIHFWVNKNTTLSYYLFLRSGSCLQYRYKRKSEAQFNVKVAIKVRCYSSEPVYSLNIRHLSPKYSLLFVLFAISNPISRLGFDSLHEATTRCSRP